VAGFSGRVLHGPDASLSVVGALVCAVVEQIAGSVTVRRYDNTAHIGARNFVVGALAGQIGPKESCPGPYTAGCCPTRAGPERGGRAAFLSNHSEAIAEWTSSLCRTTDSRPRPPSRRPANLGAMLILLPDQILGEAQLNVRELDSRLARLVVRKPRQQSSRRHHTRQHERRGLCCVRRQGERGLFARLHGRLKKKSTVIFLEVKKVALRNSIQWYCFSVSNLRYQ
jgi:hypothetical protein